jgi:hypothetical protein
VGQRLNDEDVDRIARRVVEKLILYALVILGAVWVAPMLLFAMLTAAGHFTSGLPFAVAVAITASVIAIRSSR